MKLYGQIPTTEPFVLDLLDGKVYNYFTKTVSQVVNEISEDDTKWDYIAAVLLNKFVGADKILYSHNLEDMISTLEKYDSSVPSDDLRNIGVDGSRKLFSHMMFTMLGDDRSYFLSSMMFRKAVMSMVDIWNEPVDPSSRSVLMEKLRQADNEFNKFVETATWANQHNIMYFWKTSGHFRKGDMTRWETILKNKGERI